MVMAHGRETLASRLRDEPTVLDGFLVKPVTASMMFDAVADARSGNAAANALSLRRPATTQLTGLRLLVVEDNPLNQQVAFELLSNEGAEVSVASTGRGGVAAVLGARPPFDAVLMDIQMPDIDGYAATAAIRLHEHLKSLPIIAMTANVMAEDKAACLAAGMDDHVGKPIDLDALVMTVLRHCPRISADGSTASLRTLKQVLVTPPVTPAPSLHQEFDKALRQIGNNRRLFLKMATMFVRDSAALAGELQLLVAVENKEGAARLLHTLQGTAGTVGARQLADYALQLERQVRAADGGLSQVFSLNEFDAFVRQSCNALLAYAKGLHEPLPLPEKPHALLDKLRVARLLDQLDALMRDRNMRALAMCEELKCAYGQSQAEELRGLEQSMNDLDFPASLARTRKLREALVS